ncbi:hypothetical protein TeGR_g9745, partial [Tetraparma gracilis]
MGPSTWHDARAACMALDMDLPVLLSQSHNNELLAAAGGEVIWLGLSDEAEEGVWTWVNGAPLSFNNWNDEEPNNAGSGEHFAALHGSLGWNDQSMTASLKFICEDKASVTGATLCSSCTPGKYSSAARQTECDGCPFGTASSEIGATSSDACEVCPAETYEEHIGGSPYTYFVSEGPTDPDSCLLDFNPSVKAGEEFRVVIMTYDFHGNPTKHMDDVFLCTLDDGDAVEVTHNDDRSVMCPILVTAAGPNRLTIVHVPTNTEVASSPISFDVSPAAADAASSTHNLGETKGIISNHGATITVQVFPRDAYGNKVVTAAGFEVKMTALGQESSSSLIPNNDYLGVIPIPEDLDATITLEFTLDGVPIGDGEMAAIVVSPPPNNDTMVLYLGAVLGILIQFAIVVSVYKRFCSSRIKRAEEQVVSIKESLKKSLDGKVSTQTGLQSLEGFDTMSDAANAVVLGAVGASSARMNPVLWYGLVGHGGLMVLLGLYQFIQRGRIKQGYMDILSGTDETLLTLAKATNKAQDKGKLVELDESSLEVRRNMVNVQISSLELGIAGLLFEDVPALVLNAAVLLLKLGAGEEGEEEGGREGREKLTTYLSFAAFAFSCLMAGRKLGMPGQRKELYMEKLHLEMALNKKKGRVEVGAERKGVRDMFASMKKLAT